ncbi:hypothetical protein Lumi_050 [Xylophilus phage Lumi]|nr:hypothetical protein Lumi_050 [Xylophilus phage Lumi]
MTDAVKNALAQAEKLAETQAATASTGNAVSTVGTAPGAVAVAGNGAPAKKLTMETIGAGSMNVDAWLKVNQFGLTIGEHSKDLLDEIVLEINMTDGVGFMPKRGIKGGNPAQYAYTFDGETANDGKPWEEACRRIRMLQPDARPYPCVDLPFTVLEDIIGPKSKQVIAKAGDRLGYTTSTTNYGTWEQVYRAADAAGRLGTTVQVKLTAIPKKNGKGNEWGIIGFELLEEAGE